MSTPKIQLLGGGATPPQSSITYAELKALRDNGELVAGQFYRITDYQCTTSQADTRAMNNKFDIIVQALSENVLSENASADHHNGDTYFANSNLSAWELKYSLDNDLTRFAWANETNGKGVIYWLKDEHENECPYDFKNIQFKRTITFENGYPELDEENDTETWVYTFCANSYHIDNDAWSELKDGSLESPYEHMSDERTTTFHHNVIKPYSMFYDEENEIRTMCGIMYLNNNVLFGYWEEIGSASDENFPYYYANCSFNNTFGVNCHNNTFGVNCHNNIFEADCYNNTFGTGCSTNTFGAYCSDNTFGTGCYNNTFGVNCYNNTFGTGCSNNTFGVNCSANTFGLDCYNNIFEVNCSTNTFGAYCSNNTFGVECYNNIFGESCSTNTFGANCSNNTFEAGYMQKIKFAIGCSYIELINETASPSNIVKYIKVNFGVCGTRNERLSITVYGNNPPMEYSHEESQHSSIQVG